MKYWKVLPVAVVIGLVAGLAGNFPQAGGADAEGPTYAKTVKPFMQTYCTDCHGATKPKAGVNLENYDTIVNGGKKLVAVGKPDDSRLCQVCEGKGKPMPPKKSKQPSAEEVQALRAWIAEGARNN